MDDLRTNDSGIDEPTETEIKQIYLDAIEILFAAQNNGWAGMFKPYNISPAVMVLMDAMIYQMQECSDGMAIMEDWMRFIFYPGKNIKKPLSTMVKALYKHYKDNDEEGDVSQDVTNIMKNIMKNYKNCYNQAVRIYRSAIEYELFYRP